MESINNDIFDGLNHEMTVKKDDFGELDIKIDEKIELPLIVIVKYLRCQNGLKHKDFAQYTRYCSRKLHRLRSGLKMKCGRNKFQKSYTECSDYTSHKHLLLLILLIERNLSAGTEIGSRTTKNVNTQLNTLNNRAKLHEIRKLRRGCNLSKLLVEVARNKCTNRSIVEVQAYQSYIFGNYYLKCSNWEKGAIELNKSMKLYQQLKLDVSIFEKSSILPHFNISKLSKSECVQAYDDQIIEMTPLIRLCLYHCKRLDILVPGCDNAVDILKINDSLNNSNMKFFYNNKEYYVPISNLEISLVELQENYKAVKQAIPFEDTEKILKFSSNMVIECFSETLMCSTTLRNKIHEEMTKASANYGAKIINSCQSHDWDAFESYIREFNLFVSIERDLIFVFQLIKYFNNPEFYTKLIFLYDERFKNISHELLNSTAKKIIPSRYPEEGVRICDIINFTISEISSCNKTTNILALIHLLEIVNNNCRSLFLSHCFGQKGKFQEAFVLCDLVKSRLEIKETDFGKICLDEDGIFQRIAILIKEISLNVNDMANKSYNIYLSNAATYEPTLIKALDFKNVNEILDYETLNPRVLPIPVKPVMFDIASDFISSPDLSNKIRKNGLVNKIFSKATSKFGLFK
ncbi:signal recognition particle SPR68 [Cryptosporidium sp. chipmunk genotype I]|uniref:signal recognition particle SPR68 n=1 Tax=Cryptosporidium sp. chipmunk genotype I TaxID=1280935 RepID=UPI003519F34B|nr:signal recognition particle SPR68 [Cryptosporidium sp. chipmunk genotype I]